MGEKGDFPFRRDLDTPALERASVDEPKSWPFVGKMGC